MTRGATCPVCNSLSVRLRFNGFTNRNPGDGKVWPVYECRACEHGFIFPAPKPDELSCYYSKSYEAYDEKHGAEGDDASVIASARESGEFRHIPVPAGK